MTQENNAQTRIRCVFSKHGTDYQSACLELKTRQKELLLRCRDPWSFGRTELTAIKEEIKEIYRTLTLSSTS